MKDRLAKHPGRVKLTPVPGQADTYDLVRADEAAESGSAYSKGNVLPDEVCDALGLDSETAEPKDALAACNALWDGLRAKNLFVPVSGEELGEITGDDHVILAGEVLCFPQQSTMDALECYNINSRKRFAVGSDYTSFNHATAYNGKFLYAYGYGSGSEKKLYRVTLGEESGEYSVIWSADSSGYNVSWLYANSLYIFGANPSNRNVMVWKNDGTKLNTLTVEGLGDGYMQGNILYTLSGHTVNKYTFNVDSFAQDASVAFPDTCIIVSTHAQLHEEMAFYALSKADFKVYRIGPDMTLQIVADFTPLVDVIASVERNLSFIMSKNRYYLCAYGMIYVFDRATYNLIGKGNQAMQLYNVASCDNGEEISFDSVGSSYKKIVKLAEKSAPILVER